MDTNELLNKHVSFQTAAWSSIIKEITIRDILVEIKSNKYSAQIDFLRELVLNGHSDDYNIHKKNLAAVTFSATFHQTRKKDSIKFYNQILVLDIDKLDQNDLARIMQNLNEDEFVFAIWVSPSGKGIKGLVSINYEFALNFSNIDRSHKYAFNKLQEYFITTYNFELDESGSDYTRLCFLSADPNLIHKERYKPFVIESLPEESPKILSGSPKNILSTIISRKDALYNSFDKNNPNNRKTIQSIIRYLTKHDISITYSYDNWYKVALAIASSFTFDIGLKYFLKISKIDKGKFNETNCENMLIYCYEHGKNEISLGTIEFLANEKGYIKNKKEAVPKVIKEI